MGVIYLWTKLKLVRWRSIPLNQFYFPKSCIKTVLMFAILFIDVYKRNILNEKKGSLPNLAKNLRSFMSSVKSHS